MFEASGIEAVQRLASILPSASNVAHSCPAAFFMYAIILNHALLMGKKKFGALTLRPWGMWLYICCCVAVCLLGVNPKDKKNPKNLKKK